MLRAVKIKGQNIEMCFILVGGAEGIIQLGLGYGLLDTFEAGYDFAQNEIIQI